MQQKISAAKGQRDGVNLTLDDVERRYVLDVLARSEDDKTLAAHILGIDLSTLYRKLKRYEDT